MTLQTYEEEEILARVRRLEHMVQRIERMCEEILHDVGPETFAPTVGIVVIPKIQ